MTPSEETRARHSLDMRAGLVAAKVVYKGWV
jgi:hypothetical protein